MVKEHVCEVSEMFIYKKLAEATLIPRKYNKLRNLYLYILELSEALWDHERKSIEVESL